ncbi:helix-turn-helix domain-containing protein [Gluconacetobacter sp. 1b LMG 1731]|uniref:Helix-turn-helix domain-containing protein n=1 Tax=Gluconacetobacter dulcium TaxID=2729096 RepID=A0A7W4IKS8_9PROT|nr:helix-turn-helix domain-containing protein [Gluconacetobacter dulcium]MBB2193813.1 helix-turn-helix domain-containing protein [Gluconacetobacter dulcium]
MKAKSMGNPRPQAIRSARATSGLTQTEAAEIVFVSLATWARWEAGTCPMPRGLYDLFLINTNQREVVCERGVLQGLDALISDAIALRRKIVSARVE